VVSACRLSGRHVAVQLTHLVWKLAVAGGVPIGSVLLPGKAERAAMHSGTRVETRRVVMLTPPQVLAVCARLHPRQRRRSYTEHPNSITNPNPHHSHPNSHHPNPHSYA
jgi:hypothetical protein